VNDTPTAPASCARLAAELIVQGCLPMIQGAAKGKAPIQPVVLSREERAKLGLTDDKSLTLFYAAGGEGVFFDGAANTFQVWFKGEDCEEATSALHTALMRAFPSAKQLDDVPHKEDKRMRARVYRVELGGGKLATISTSFGKTAGKHTFHAEVKAFQRTN
jgi:hypothetical protein